MKWSLGQQRMYRAQVALLKKHCAWDDLLRRDVLHRVTGKRSTLELDRDGLTEIIREQSRLLREAGVRLPWSRARTKWSREEYIANLVMRLGWTDQPARLCGFIERLARGWKSEVLHLTDHEKSRLIVALKALLADQAAGRARIERPAPTTPRPRAKFKYIPGGLEK